MLYQLSYSRSTTAHRNECKLPKNGGGRRIRTSEAFRSRFTVCPLWPLGNPSRYYSIIKWSRLTDSNPRPADYKSAALPTELNRPQTPFQTPYFKFPSFLYREFLQNSRVEILPICKKLCYSPSDKDSNRHALSSGI
jgi:hypothetical protein